MNDPKEEIDLRRQERQKLLEEPTRVHVPVSELEFCTFGNTIWVHSPMGATVLRIKTTGRIITDLCGSNPCSHVDLIVQGDIHLCLAEDAQIEDSFAEPEEEPRDF